ncbi:MAG: DEAD/DEAH box helicase family protein, partial [Faecalibacterium sp.]|nr:DEAD/DEAH box helicase family protein [Faecalibacterium sp.]
MGIRLYDHNEKAYQRLLHCLQNSDRAAIIHPTGTGKSYIAFKLIEDHPNQNFLWLSPSDYIFRTQCENLYRSDPQLTLQNVRFLTYAKLTYLLSEEVCQLSADYIILD